MCRACKSRKMEERVSKNKKVKVKYKIVDRRPGDIAECFSDPTKAKEELGWEATLTIDDMCKDAYNFILKSKKN